MWRSKKFRIVVGAILILGILAYGGWEANNYLEWSLTQDAIAAGGYPYQIGLTGVTIIPCTVSCNGGCCVGGALCSTLDPGRCTMYSYVSGAPSGGMGNQALFQKTALSMAGVTAGGQLIAGGMGPTMMDGGVLAGSGGCYNCMAEADKSKWEKAKDLVGKYTIALFK